MRKTLLLTVMVVGGIVLLWRPWAVFADDGAVRWREIVGVIQPGGTVGTGTGAVAGGLAPWHTTGGRAAVNLATGNLHFVVRGLVLAGTNFIGTRGDINQVKGTLVCDTMGTADGNSTLVDTDLVPLSLEGNARFRGNVGPLPDACLNSPNIAFLIRTAGGRWIANGAVRVLEDEDDDE